MRRVEGWAVVRLAGLMAGLLGLTGCLMVGGYSSGGGWFMWPGSFGVLLVLLLVFFLLRRRR